MKKYRFWILLSVLVLASVAFWFNGPQGGVLRWPLTPARGRLSRPYGMAPQAFEAFVRACGKTKINPHRIGQTIGEHPLSVGYHKKDGITKWKGEAFEYSAAVDLGTSDLNDYQIKLFLEALAQQGFAAFYRHEGRWRGNEHIHAIYGLLPMKSQLRGQVKQFLRERRAARRKPLKWARRFKSL